MDKPLSIIELIEYAGDRESDEAPEGRRRKHLRGAISMGLPLKGTSSAHCPANDIKLIALFKEHPL